MDEQQRIIVCIWTTSKIMFQHGNNTIITYIKLKIWICNKNNCPLLYYGFYRYYNGKNVILEDLLNYES